MNFKINARGISRSAIISSAIAVIFLLASAGSAIGQYTAGNAVGAQSWQKTYFGQKDLPLLGYSFIQTSDGGFLITGWKDASKESEMGLLLMKTDPSGEIEWVKVHTKNNKNTRNSFGYRVWQTSDGGFLIFCFLYKTDLIKIDAKGNILWERDITEGQGIAVAPISKTRGDGVVFAGFESRGDDVYLYELDANGNVAWKTELCNNADYGISDIEQVSENEFLVLANAYNNKAFKFKSNFQVYKVTVKHGEKAAWNLMYAGGSEEFGRSVEPATGGGFIVSGVYDYYECCEKNDAFAVRVDAQGVKKWEIKRGGADNESFTDVVQTTDFGFVFAGTTSSYGEGFADIYIVKVNHAGNFLWEKTFGTSINDFPMDLIKTQDKGWAVLSAKTHPSGNEINFTVIKFDKDGKTEEKPGSVSIQNFEHK